MQKFNFKDHTMNDSDLQRVYNYPIDPRISKTTTDKRFVNIHNGQTVGTHWSCFYMKGNKSFYFGSFG